MQILHHLIVRLMPLVPKPIVRIVSKPYVAGPHLKDAVVAVKDLNSQGAVCTMDVLGESAKELDECKAAVTEYLTVLDTIITENLNCNISLKPTQLGLLIDKEACYQNIKIIVEKAKSLDIFVRIDMEDVTCTSDTIALFKRLESEFDNVGIVLQAYLRRSVADINDLIGLGTNFRLCKGIYNEPRAHAFKDPRIVNQNFGYLLYKALSTSCYVGVATHDEQIVWETLELIDQLGLEHDDYEFQMLLGVEEELRKILIDEGHVLRVYVPYGVKWYAYSMRRLKENPKIAMYIIKALIGKVFKRGK